MQTLVELGPSLDPMKNTIYLYAYFNNNVDSKRHIIIRTAILCNEINSGQIMKNTIYMFNFFFFFLLHWIKVSF